MSHNAPASPAPSGRSETPLAGVSSRRSTRHRRSAVGVAALAVVGLGLLVHVSTDGPLGDFVADALYAVCAYLVLACAFPWVRPRRVALIAWAMCMAIELFQLTGVPAALSGFTPFRLLLGTTFSALDLVAYSLGVLVVLGCDSGVRSLWLARHRDKGN